MASHFRINDNFPIQTLAMEYVILVDAAPHHDALGMDDQVFNDSEQLLTRIYRRLGMENGREAINKARKVYEIMNG